MHTLQDYVLLLLENQPRKRSRCHNKASTLPERRLEDIRLQQVQTTASINTTRLNQHPQQYSGIYFGAIIAMQGVSLILSTHHLLTLPTTVLQCEMCSTMCKMTSEF